MRQPLSLGRVTGYSGGGCFAKTGDLVQLIRPTCCSVSVVGVPGSTLYLTDTASGLAGAPALVSDFSGAAANPISEGGNWAILNSSGAALQATGTQLRGTAAADCYSYWTPANFGPDLEAYITFSVMAGSAVWRFASRVRVGPLPGMVIESQ